MNIKGEEMMCKKHGLDYRIACEECQARYDYFMETLTEIQNIDYNDKAVPSLLDEYDN